MARTRVGGRAKGTPNAFSRDRAERAEKEHGMLPHDRLFMIGRAYETLAKAHQWRKVVTKNAKGEEIEVWEFKSDRDRELYDHYLQEARTSYRDAAPYYAPRRAAIRVEHKPVDLSLLTDRELADYERLLKSIAAKSGEPRSGDDREGTTTH